MMHATRACRAFVSRIWQTDRPLTAVGLLMMVVLIGNIAGLIDDPRTITGAPAWLKPAKFAVSTAIYSVTLAWLFSFLPDWRRTRTIAGWTTAAVFVIEVAIIDLQAWRGTTSHFNTSTLADAVLFSVMGAAIALQTITSGFVAYALWCQPFSDRVVGTALRAGMVITVLGASAAGLMTVPTRAQLSGMEATHSLPVSGAHTVGAPDGGPGLPGTGWSQQHGDLRVPHFFGLHAMQVLPVLAIVLRRGRDTRDGVRTVRIAATSYAALCGVLLVQALRGEALMAPGFLTGIIFVVWALGSAAAFVAARTQSVDPSGSTMARA